MENYLNIYGKVKKVVKKRNKRICFFMHIFDFFNSLRFTFVLICLFVFLSCCFVSLS